MRLAPYGWKLHNHPTVRAWITPRAEALLIATIGRAPSRPVSAMIEYLCDDVDTLVRMIAVAHGHMDDVWDQRETLSLVASDSHWWTLTTLHSRVQLEGPQHVEVREAAKEILRALLLSKASPLWQWAPYIEEADLVLGGVRTPKVPPNPCKGWPNCDCGSPGIVLAACDPEVLRRLDGDWCREPGEDWTPPYREEDR